MLCAPLGMPAAGAADDGRLRFAHLSPDTPAVDVAVAPLPPGTSGPLTDPGDDAATGLAYGAVSDVTTLPAGSYAVSVRAAGAGRTAPPALSARVDVPAGGSRTVTLAGPFADLALTALSDDLTAPPPGTARVRVLSAAATAGPLDVRTGDGVPLASALPPGSAAEPRAVPGGQATLLVGGTEVPVSFAAGSVVTLLVLDDPAGGLTVRPVVDAAGPEVVPVGGVEAGTGPLPGGPAVAVLAVGAVLLAATGRRRRVLLASAALVAAGLAAPATAVAAPLRPAVQVVPATADPAALPVRLRIPVLGVDAPLTGAGLDDGGALVPPADPAVVGWHAGGPVPGATGPAVVTGHVNWAGSPGVLARLDELTPGAEVAVTRADGSTARFTVTRVVSRPKADFPAAEVYAPTPGAELRLITCGGAFDRSRGSYEDNVVVFAEAR